MSPRSFSSWKRALFFSDHFFRSLRLEKYFL